MEQPPPKEQEGALISRGQWRPDDSEERLRVTAALAAGLQEKGYEKHQRSAIVATWEEMAALLPEDWPEKQRYELLAWLAGPAALLTDRADGTLAFTHLSFQEYLTAWHLNATVEGREAQVEAFRARLAKSIWWETLLLWAALIGRQNREWLAPVLEAVIAAEDKGLALCGMMLADGLGSEVHLEAWVERLLDELHRGWPWPLDACLRAWAGSRQDERKQQVGRRLELRAPDLTWLAWVRTDAASKEGDFLAELAPPRPGSLAAEILVRAPR